MTVTDYFRGETLTADELNMDFGTCISRNGDIMSGPFTLYEDPLVPMEAATKRYVDQRTSATYLANVTLSDTPPSNPLPGMLWWDTVGTQMYVWYTDVNSSQWVNVTNAGGVLTGGTLTGPLYWTATGGNTPISAQDRSAYYVSVKDFGAVGDQSTNDTAAIQAALNTGKNVYLPAGNYRINNTLTVGTTTRAQTLFGDGKASRLYIDTQFNTSATAVITLAGIEDSAPTIRDLELFFWQPASFTRASMAPLPGTGGGIQYPVAIDEASSNRFRLERIRISGGAWIGIQCTNSGWWIRDIEESCLNIGLNIITSTGGDFWHVTGWHHWNFGIAWSGTPISDGQAYAIQIGNGAGGELQDINIFGAKLRIDAGTGYAQITNLALDGSCCEIASCNWAEITNVYASANAVNQAAFTLTGGQVSIVNPHGWPANGQPYISNNGANLIMFGGRPQNGGTNIPVISHQAGFMTLTACTIIPAASYSTSAPIVVSGPGVIIMQGCRMAGNPSGTTAALTIATDARTNVVVGNQWNQWSFTPPGNLGCYGPNTGSAAATGTHFPSAVTFDGGISGTTTNDSATAGNVGEYITSSVGVGSALALTTVTNINVTSISLTAGDWTVGGTVGFTGTSNQCTLQNGGASSTSAVLPLAAGGLVTMSGVNLGNTGMALPQTRFSLSATTTLYLVANATFASGAASAFGFIAARRVR
jgi:hypothetical protein